jgi:hypothetical protein
MGCKIVNLVFEGGKSKSRFPPCKGKETGKMIINTKLSKTANRSLESNTTSCKLTYLTHTSRVCFIIDRERDAARCKKPQAARSCHQKHFVKWIGNKYFPIHDCDCILENNGKYLNKIEFKIKMLFLLRLCINYLGSKNRLLIFANKRNNHI